VSALHSPRTAIVDFPAVARALAAEVVATGGCVRLGFEVERITQQRSEVVVGSTREEALTFDLLVVCAGLQSDRVARLAGDTDGPAIVPFRGEYYRLVPSRTSLVRGLIYPVPDPRYPFLGVHFTRRVDGGVDIGPNAVLALAREGYRRRDLHPREVWETLSWPGFWPMARRHWRTGLKEMYGSFWKRAFVAEARSFVPELTVADVVPAAAGVRAQAVDRDGSLVDDFRIGRVGRVVTVRNAPSPAATSSLAIAEYIAEQVHTG
jgi:L-2-hydroxyglutarate oxidase LhgO